MNVSDHTGGVKVYVAREKMALRCFKCKFSIDAGEEFTTDVSNSNVTYEHLDCNATSMKAHAAAHDARFDDGHEEVPF